MLVERREIAEIDRIAAARRELMLELGEGIGDPVKLEGLRFEQGSGRAGAARHRVKQAGDVVGVKRSGIGRGQAQIVIGMGLAEPAQHPHAGAPGHLEQPQEQDLAVTAGAHHDHRLVALGAEHVSCPGLRPVEGLCAGGGRNRLQLLPNRLEALQVAC